MALQEHQSTSSETPTQSDPSQTTSKPPTISSSKPEVSLPPTSHLDPNAYVRGSYPITIGQDVLIHPRVYLLSIHGPLIIGDGCIIGEKCVLGGPVPTSGPNSSSLDRPELTRSAGALRGDMTRPTIIESQSHLHPNVTVNHGATIKGSSIIESNSTIGSNASIGSHSKVSANLTVFIDLPDWTVIWGSDSDQRYRRRRVIHDNAIVDSHQLIEEERLKVMARERNGTIAILKTAAMKTLSSGQRKR